MSANDTGNVLPYTQGPPLRDMRFVIQVLVACFRCQMSLAPVRPVELAKTSGRHCMRECLIESHFNPVVCMSLEMANDLEEQRAQDTVLQLRAAALISQRVQAVVSAAHQRAAQEHCLHTRLSPFIGLL